MQLEASTLQENNCVGFSCDYSAQILGMRYQESLQVLKEVFNAAGSRKRVE